MKKLNVLFGCIFSLLLIFALSPVDAGAQKKLKKKRSLPLVPSVVELLDRNTGEVLRQMKDGERLNPEDFPDELSVRFYYSSNRFISRLILRYKAFKTKTRSAKIRPNKTGYYTININKDTGSHWVRANTERKKNRAAKRRNARPGRFLLTFIWDPSTKTSPDKPIATPTPPAATPTPTPNPPVGGDEGETSPTPSPTPDLGDSPGSSPSPSPSPNSSPNDGLSSWTIQDSTIHRDGEATFPIGIYYVSHYANEQVRRMDDIEIIANAGFDFIHTPIDRGDRDFLDKCDELGVQVTMEFNDTDTLLLDLFGEHPAMAIMSTFDDVDARDGGNARYSVSHVRNKSAQLKARAPRMLNYVSAGTNNHYQGYVGTTDLFAMQTYPVPSEPLSSTYFFLSSVGEEVDQYEETAFIGNLQSFGWFGTQRVPTGQEMRNMTYQSLIAGVKGILYYTYYDPVMDMEDHPDLWSEMESTVDELHQLSPVLLHGEFTKESTGDAEVFAGLWEHEGVLYVVVSNTKNGNRTVNIDLPNNAGSSLTNLFPSRADGLSIINGRLRGTVNRRDTHVYTIPLS